MLGLELIVQRLQVNLVYTPLPEKNENVGQTEIMLDCQQLTVVASRLQTFCRQLGRWGKGEAPLLDTM